MRSVRMLITMAFASLLMLPLAAAAQDTAPPDTVATMSVAARSAPTPAQTPDIPMSFNLIGLAAVVGATKRMNLNKTFLFEGETFGPGADVEVPSDFPDLDKNGDVIFPEGSQAAKNQARDRRMSSPPNTGGVDTGEGRAPSETVSGKQRAELEGMKVADLEELSLRLNIDVDREDADGNVEEGAPLKGDYVRALGHPK